MATEALLMQAEDSRKRNRQTSGDWGAYDSHRRKISDVLAALAPVNPVSKQKPRLIVLGAGNLNDLDLVTLQNGFGECTLVDWDLDSVREGVARQLGNVDALAEASSLDDAANSGWLKAVAMDLSVNNNRIDQDLSALGTYDVVASLGVISQLILQALKAVSEDDTMAMVQQVLATRRHHFDVLQKLMIERGRAMLTTEIFGSDTCKQLGAVSEEDLLPLLQAEVNQGNFFTGLQPTSFFTDLQQFFVPYGRNAKMLQPWRWDFVARVYAVVGYTIA